MIDWVKIQHAETIARSRAFQKIEVPWIVSQDIIQMTMPAGHALVNVSCEGSKLSGCLIGSGESGFLEIRKSRAFAGRYVTTTPCFRDEPVYNELYRPWFMKTELMIARPENAQQALSQVLETAKTIMGTWSRELQELKTLEGIDLMLNGVEVGSYGIRECEDFQWVYGTGLAEPRFSHALGLK